MLRQGMDNLVRDRMAPGDSNAKSIAMDTHSIKRALRREDSN